MDLLSVKTTNSVAANPTSSARTTSSSGLEGLDFQQMLPSMLMSGGLSGISGTSSSDSDLSTLGASASSMMMPMMFIMLEQMLMKQMELLQAGKLSPTATTAADTKGNTQPQPTELSQPAILQANQARAAAAAATSTAAAGEASKAAPTSLPAANPTASGAATSVSVSNTAVSAGGHATPFGEPALGPLTQGYHSGHNGLDIGIVIGTPVHSSMDGKVIYAGWSPIGYGNLVIVQNGDYQTYYAHLSKIPVTVGQTIQAGSVIGSSGSTGNSTGPHLHYEIRYKGKNIDPTSLTLNKSI